MNFFPSLVWLRDVYWGYRYFRRVKKQGRRDAWEAGKRLAEDQ